MNIINKIHGVISEPTKQKEENQVIWARVIAATILNVIVIGALSFVFEGQPEKYLFFIGIAFIGEYLVMKYTW